MEPNAQMIASMNFGNVVRINRDLMAVAGHGLPDFAEVPDGMGEEEAEGFIEYQLLNKKIDFVKSMAPTLPLYIYENLISIENDVTDSIFWKANADSTMGIGIDAIYEYSEILFQSGIVAASYESVLALADPVINGIVGKLPIMIKGDRGVGKDALAQFYYKYSGRDNGGKNFFPINCAAFAESLLDSELFGHEKGAFTGATSKKKGIFEEADGGVVFLDEISTMPLSAQTKLLRFLQTGDFRRVGGVEKLTSDVYVIAGTNTDLWEQVEQYRFRADLHDRISSVVVNVSALSERDVRDRKALVIHFITQTLFGEGLPSKNIHLSATAVLPIELFELMCNLPYSGNIREMKARCTYIALLDRMQGIYVGISKEKHLIKENSKKMAKKELEAALTIIGLKEKTWKYHMINAFVKGLYPETKKQILGLEKNEAIPAEFWANETEIIIGKMLPHLSPHCTERTQDFTKKYADIFNLSNDEEPVATNRLYSFAYLFVLMDYKLSKKRLDLRFDKAWIEYVNTTFNNPSNVQIARMYNIVPSYIGKIKKGIAESDIEESAEDQ